MGRASIGYINKDYESIRQELLAKIPQLTDRWTDFNHSDLGVVLLDLFCGVGDMLAYYLDAQAAEAFLPTARQRDSPVASTTTLRFRLSAPLGKDLTIPAGTACRALLSDGEADFETVEDGLIPRGVLSVDIPTRQGVRRTETFTSTGLPFQRIRLTGGVIAQGTITVTVGDDAWSEVDHLQDSLADSRHFMADLDALDISTLIFGDGQSGAVPAQGSAIAVSYLQTIGDQGNLGPNRITQLLSPVYLDGGQVPLTVTNPVPATGGASREALEHARRQAPAELRSLWKAVTLEDYQALAEGYPGVAKGARRRLPRRRQGQGARHQCLPEHPLLQRPTGHRPQRRRNALGAAQAGPRRVSRTPQGHHGRDHLVRPDLPARFHRRRGLHLAR